MVDYPPKKCSGSPAGWLPLHRDQLWAQSSVTTMGSLYLFTTQHEVWVPHWGPGTKHRYGFGKQPGQSPSEAKAFNMCTVHNWQLHWLQQWCLVMCKTKSQLNQSRLVQHWRFASLSRKSSQVQCTETHDWSPWGFTCDPLTVLLSLQ